MLLGGIIGVFIPFNSLTLNVVEANQKRYFIRQNTKLASKIRLIRENVFTLKTKLDTLFKRKEKLEGFFFSAPPHPPGYHSQIKNNFHYIDSMTMPHLEQYVRAMNNFYICFAEIILKKPMYFNELPLIHPVSGSYVISGDYGMMKDPFTGYIKNHHGIDYSAGYGTEFFSPAIGVVSKIENNGEWGKVLYIEHSFGITTRYAHCGSIAVYKGQKVKKGTILGTIGISGLSSGPHVHYEILHNDVPINPLYFIFNTTVAFNP